LKAGKSDEVDQNFGSPVNITIFTILNVRSDLDLDSTIWHVKLQPSGMQTELQCQILRLVGNLPYLFLMLGASGDPRQVAYLK
jgi:dynactin complex subunit